MEKNYLLPYDESWKYLNKGDYSMKKSIIIFILLFGYIITALVVPPDLSGDYISQGIDYGFEISAYAEEEAELSSDGVAVSIGDVTASQGETVEVPIDLSKNNSGITGFRIIMNFSDLTPDLTYGVGGYIKENADDILYNFSNKQVLIVWGSGKGNKELEKDKFSENNMYSYKETTDNFFTVHFTIPENAKAGSKYTVSISDESRIYLADGTEIPIKAAGTIEIEKSKKKENKTNSSKEEKSDNDNQRNENTVSEDSENTSGKGVSLKYLIGFGIFSVIIELVLAFCLLFIIGENKKLYDKARKMIDEANKVK